LTHRVFSEKGNVKVDFRMDISHFYCTEHQGEYDKDFRANKGNEILEPVDTWVINHHSLQDNYPMIKAGELRKNGKRVYMYGDTPIIDEAANQALVRIYNVWYNNLNGFMVWKTISREVDGEDGKDFIIYALKTGDNQASIFPSLRLNLLKRGVDDTRILTYLREQNILNDKELIQILQKYLSGDLNSLWNFRTTIHKKL
ncbi:MAG: hypothetical protein WAN36_16135, partial [Calditrichia bacterium]